MQATDLKQMELDLFEERLLKQVFGNLFDDGRLQVNPLLRGYLRDKHGVQCIETSLQQIIHAFEDTVKPTMYDNGIVSATKLAEKIRVMFPQWSDYIELIPKKDFRLVDILEQINLQNLIQQFIGAR